MWFGVELEKAKYENNFLFQEKSSKNAERI